MSRLSERKENFKKAFKIYETAVCAYRKNGTDDILKMALIQAFEVTFELSWKVLKDYINLNGTDVYLPKQVIKEAFNSEVIKDGQIWINMLNDRNSTSHEYNMDKIDLILNHISSKYFDELLKFKNDLDKLDG